MIQDHRGFTVREVYYEEDRPVATMLTACSPYGETVEELKHDAEMFLKAFDLPVLDYELFARQD